MKKKIIKKIFICATEQSGDNIGEKIIKELRKVNSNKVFDGVGGALMKPHLYNQFYSLKEFKTLGLIEVLFSISKYFKMINYLSMKILNSKYDLIITIDSPDFNYPLIKKIRNRNYGGKVIQIVAPTVWAWRSYRAKKFSRVFDEIYTLFPFENKFFEQFNLKTTYIGHPIYDIKNKSDFIKNKKIIAFLPGSRLGEINSLFNYYQSAYEYLNQKKLKFEIFIPTLPHLENEIRKKTKDWKIVTTITTNKKTIENYFLRTKVAVVCSGTASLEIAKRNIPQLIIYKLNLFTEIILKFFVNVKYVNIINIIQKKMIIPELLNSKLNKKMFLKKFDELIFNDKSNIEQLKSINKVLKKISLSKSPYSLAVQSIKKYL